MHLFTCHTPAHDCLYRDWFLPSLPTEFVSHPHEFSDIIGPGDFLSEEFLCCIRRKVNLILESLEQNPGEILLWSDVDIIFGRTSPKDLLALLEQSGKKLLFQRESPRITDANTGFFLCRANPEVADFFRRVKLHLQSNPGHNEQMAVNHLLQTKVVPWAGTLPLRFYARTHGWPPPRNWAIYHANYTKGPDGVGQKISQFQEMRRLERWGEPARIWSCLRRIPPKLLRQL